MDLFSKYKTDADKERDGVWVPLDGESRIRIARTNNPLYREAMVRKMNRYKMAAKSKVIPEDAWLDIVNELVAETILVDWEGITEKGQPLPYSVENAKRVLTELKDFREMVLSIADNMENFKEELDEGTEKNSVRP